MADIKLQAVIEAEDKASKKIEGVGLSFGKMAGAVAVGQAAFAAFNKVVAVGTEFLKDSLAASREAEVSQAKVNAILKTLTGSFEENTKAVQEAANAAMKLGFDDEDAAESMAKLLQFTGKTTEAQKAFQAAMDISRLKGIDLESATKMLSLALDGNGKILSELNVKVPENATKTQVLGAVLEKVAGQAQAFGNTSAGAQEKLAVSIENVKEKFGDALAKGLQPFITKLTDWINKPETQKFIEELATKLGKVLEQILKLVEIGLPQLILGLKKVQGWWDSWTTALSKIIIQVEKVKEFMSIGKNFENPFSRIGDAVGGLLPGREHGGLVSSGKPHMVGEAGPELFIPSSGGRIVPNNQLGGGGTTVNFYNPTVRNDQDLHDIVSAINDALSTQSRLARTGAL